MATHSGESHGSSPHALMLLLLSSGFFLTGLLFHYMPMIVDTQIKRQIELATNQEIIGFWSSPPVDLHSFYWLYEVTNHDQFMAGEKVRVRKVGPFHFTSRIEKKIIELSDNKYRLTYNSTRHIWLNETAAQLTGSQIDVQMWLINPLYASMVEAIRELTAKMDPQMRPMIVASINRLTERFNESLLIRLTPREFLVGRRVLLFDKLRKFATTFSDGEPLPGMPQMPDIVKGDTFGLVSVQNNTWSGPYEIYTGYQASQPSLGEIISYQGRRRLAEFSGRCNRLQASAGELRPMPIGPEQTLELFQPPLCRIVHLKPTGVRKVREGLAVAYQLAPEDFLSAEQNPDNRCYCVNGTTNNYCSLNGVLETAPCSMWSPLVVTMNNMQLDPRVTDTIQDFEPELLSADVDGRLPKADNQSQMLILRRLGVPVQVDLSSTIFMKVIRDPQFRLTSSVPEVSYIPMVMVRETAAIPPKLGQIIVDLEAFLALTQHLKVVMYLSALVLLCWLAGRYFNMASRDRVEPETSGSSNTTETTTTTAAASNRRQPPPSSRGAGGAEGNAANGSSPPLDNSSLADSLRSQRQSSVDPAALSLASGDGLAASNAAGGAGVIGKRALVFSQVNELRAAQKSEQKSRQANATATATTTNSSAAAAGGEQLATEAESPDAGVDVAAARTYDDLDRATNDAPPDRKRNKSWFVKVASNFLRILNGLRTTISDAGQLDMSENDYRQDKQLELLAGKIDNWQRYNNDLVGAPTCGEPQSLDGADKNDENHGQEEINRMSQQQQQLESVGRASNKSASENDERDELPTAGQTETDAPLGAEVATATRPVMSHPRRPKRSLAQQVSEGEGGGGGGKGADERDADKGKCVGDIGTERRQSTANSTHSNKTVINNKGANVLVVAPAPALASMDTNTTAASDTSGDESSTPDHQSHVIAADKSAALEQVELALAADCAGSAAVGGEGGAARGAKQPVVMINSSTSIDDGFFSTPDSAKVIGVVSDSEDDDKRLKAKDVRSLDIRVC